MTLKIGKIFEKVYDIKNLKVNYNKVNYEKVNNIKNT